MGKADYFIPGLPKERPLGIPFWPSIPLGVTEAYVKAYAPPEGLVLDPFCSDPDMLREMIEAGRRVIAVNFNPLAIFTIRACGLKLDPREIDAAFTRLADSPKGEVPLRIYLRELYQVQCPSCGGLARASYFVWEASEEGKKPVEKALDCPRCGDKGIFPVEESDLRPLQGLREKGPDYWYVLTRLLPRYESPSPLIESLPLVYTPRNLHCLNAIFVKIQALLPDRSPVTYALKLAFLLALQKSLSLYSEEHPLKKPARLRPPSRFVEPNAWLAFQEAIDAAKGLIKPIRFVELNELAEGKAGVFLASWNIRRLEKEMAQGRVDLLITAPPVLDNVYWPLAFLWAGWLLGPSAASSLRPFVQERAFGWDWYEESMRRAFRRLRRMVVPGGVLVLIGQALPPACVEALLMAADRAGLAPESFSFQEEKGELAIRLILSNPGQMRPPPSPPALTLDEGGLREIIRRSVLEVMNHYGEPMTLSQLRLAVAWWIASRGGWHWHKVKEGSSARAHFRRIQGETCAALAPEDILRRGGGKGIGLADYGSAHPPLTDRVELEALEALRMAAPAPFEELAEAVFARFPGPFTPSQELVKACLSSYGEELPSGAWKLRAEDDPQRRQRDRREMEDILINLGQRMGFETSVEARGEGTLFDVIWREVKHGKPPTLYGFRIESTAAFTRLFLLHPDPRPFRAYLVIPGGRASLVYFKKQHVPAWSSLPEGNWQFIKYRHLRRLAAEESIDRYSLQKIIGLDPVVERPGAQIPLL
ncbi:MAG: hypothetical protein DRI61_02735 [Chloroflexi bacterium]|nr:MAG: hypothetical protein DRI61_02735 [Chloroflexota bacterium]